MPYKKMDTYRDFPFPENISRDNFYVYSNIKSLTEFCNENRYRTLKCRTIGILQSINGHFFLSNIDNIICDTCIQVSVSYLKSELPSTVFPVPVQLFGIVQWKNKPVLFATLLQVLTVQNALRIKSTMSEVEKLHLPTDR